MIKPEVIYEDLGLISYKKAWDYQKVVQQRIIKEKREADKEPKNRLLLCEHNPVFTLGKSGKVENLIMNPAQLEANGIEFYKINRGGDITYHGPGQITGYPIFDLDQFYNDVHRYVRELEQVVINVLEYFDLNGERVAGFTGVWLQPSSHNTQSRKICAIGVHMSRWVSMHGFALNVKPDLSHFTGIVPCGIQDSSKTVTSISEELNQSIDLQKVKLLLKSEFENVFQYEYLIEN